MGKIESEKNKKFQYWCGLHNGKSLKKSQHYLVCGERFVREILQQHSEAVDSILLSEKHLSLLPASSAKKILLSPPLFQTIDRYGSHFPILVLRQFPLQSFPMSAASSGRNLYLPIGDPSNLGAVLRSAAAFAVDRVILLQEACSVFHSKCQRAAAANILDLPLFVGPRLADLHIPGLFYLDAVGENLREQKASQDFNLVVGEEGPGLPQNIKDTGRGLAIPMHQSVESLNVAVATSIALYQLCLDTIKKAEN